MPIQTPCVFKLYVYEAFVLEIRDTFELRESGNYFGITRADMISMD